ncbi:MAG: alpha/beta hydrolase [Solirubrobacterales bacterium]
MIKTDTRSREVDAGLFETKCARLGNGLELAYVHEGVGGYPLVLLHGWPETKRIWWRNIEPLARAGFEVIVPDLRGFGDSGLAPDGFYDQVAVASDVHMLVRDVLGHDRCAGAGGDWGGVVLQELGLRFEGFVERQCIFNTVLPLLKDEYRAAGLEPPPRRERRATADYFVRQGREADVLAGELDSVERRRRYIEQFYGPRLWGVPGSFTRQQIDFMTEPFAADEAKLRASFGLYEVAMGTREPSEVPRFFERNPTPTLALYGPADHVVWPDFAERCEVVFSELIGPFVVPRAGHFLQWERADVLNQGLIYFLRELVAYPITFDRK